jgi:hypothetical protein
MLFYIDYSDRQYTSLTGARRDLAKNGDNKFKLLPSFILKMWWSDSLSHSKNCVLYSKGRKLRNNIFIFLSL